MKKIFSLCLALTISVCACGRKEGISELTQLQQQLAEMEGYACTATLTRTTENGENSYETKQYYKSTGEYRLELTAPEGVAGNYTVFDGEHISQYNPRLNDSIIRDVPASQHRSELFLGQFIENYMQSEGVSVETAALNDAKCVVLEAVIPGKDENLATEKLWVDRETLLPVRFVIYDANGKERYRTEYHTFAFNPTFDADIFQIEE